MKYRTRTYYTEGQKALMWERWKTGDSLQQIALLLDRFPVVFLAPQGVSLFARLNVQMARHYIRVQRFGFA